MSLLRDPRRFAPILVGVVLLLYANSLGNGYVFDDVKVIQENETIRSFSAAAGIFRDIFGYTPLEVKGNRIDPSYRPVRFLSYALDYAITRAIFGDFEPSSPPPLIFHFTNVILHGVSAVLVFLLALRLLPGSRFGPAIVALLFAAHPVQTEAVTYLSGRRDVLFAVFYLLGLLAYLRGKETGRWPGAVICVGFYLLSLFTKEMAVTLPCIALLLSPPRRGGKSGGWALLLVLFVIAAAFSAWKVLLKNPGGLGEESVLYWGGGLVTTLLTIPRLLFHYLGLILFPLRLSVDYSFDAFPASRSLLDPWTTAAALAGVAAIAAGVVLAWRRGARIVPVAALWFLITLLPVLQFIPHPERVAERFLYLPLVGPLLLAGWWFPRLAGRLGRPRLALGIPCLLVLLFGVRVMLRNTDWSDPERLWGSAVAAHPRCARAQAAFGAALMERGRYAEAMPHLDACLEVLPLEGSKHRLRGLSLGALFNRAVCSYEMEEFDEALRDLEVLLQEKDAFGKEIRGQEKAALIDFNLGGIYYRLGREEDAIRRYQEALKFESSRDLAAQMREAHLHLGKIYYNRGEREEGVRELHRALELTPDHPRQLRIRFDLGEAYRKMERYADAEAVYREALLRDPGSSEIRYRLAQVLMETDLGKAEVELRRLLEEDPEYLPGLYSLADMEFRMGRLAEAEARAMRVIARDPTHRPARDLLVAIRHGRVGEPKVRVRDPDLLYRAGVEKMEGGEYEEALSFFREAIRVKGEFADAHCMGGLCLLLLEREVEAHHLLARAIEIESGHPGAREALARLAMAKGRDEEAETHLRAALEDPQEGTPSTAVIRLLLAGILQGRGEETEAVGLLERAREEGPPRADICLQLLHLYLAAGLLEKARDLFAEIIERWPDSPEAERAGSLLEGRESRKR